VGRFGTQCTNHEQVTNVTNFTSEF